MLIDLKCVFEGYNGTIFTYGQVSYEIPNIALSLFKLQTGSGKTYTILGDYEDERRQGIIPRALKHIFAFIAQDKTANYEVQLGYLQIYMELVNISFTVAW